MLIVSVCPSVALFALRSQNQAYDAIQYVTNTLLVNSSLLEGRADHDTIKAGLEQVSLGNQLATELQELGRRRSEDWQQKQQQRTFFPGVIRILKKDLLVVDRDKLYDNDVRDKINDISVRFQTLKMKEYTDKNIYAL